MNNLTIFSHKISKLLLIPSMILGIFLFSCDTSLLDDAVAAVSSNVANSGDIISVVETTPLVNDPILSITGDNVTVTLTALADADLSSITKSDGNTLTAADVTIELYYKQYDMGTDKATITAADIVASGTKDATALTGTSTTATVTVPTVNKTYAFVVKAINPNVANGEALSNVAYSYYVNSTVPTVAIDSIDVSTANVAKVNWTKPSLANLYFPEDGKAFELGRGTGSLFVTVYFSETKTTAADIIDEVTNAAFGSVESFHKQIEVGNTDSLDVPANGGTYNFVIRFGTTYFGNRYYSDSAVFSATVTN